MNKQRYNEDRRVSSLDITQPVPIIHEPNNEVEQMSEVNWWRVTIVCTLAFFIMIALV